MWNGLVHKISIFQQPLKVLCYCIRQQNHQERVKMDVTAKEIWPVWFRILSMKKLPPKKVSCKIISLIWKAPFIFHILPPINQGPCLGPKGSEQEGGLCIRHVWEARVQSVTRALHRRPGFPRQLVVSGYFTAVYSAACHMAGVCTQDSLVFINRKMVAGECWQFNTQPQ